MSKSKKNLADSVGISQTVYFGPTIKGVARKGTVFYGGISPQLATFCEANPIFNDMLLPVADYPEALMEMNDPESSLSIIYRRAENILGGK
jgi:hypothetical protein